MGHQFVNYCLECEWTASTDGYGRSELSRLAVDHACSTGHDVAGERPDGERAGSDRPADRKGMEEQLRSEGTNPEPPVRQFLQRRRVYSLNEAYRTDREGQDTDGAESDDRWTDDSDPDSEG